MRYAGKIGLFAIALVAPFAALSACSAITSFSDLIGGAADASAPAEASALDARTDATKDASGAEASIDAGAPSYRDTVLADSPLSYLRLDDPAGTTVAHDEVGTSFRPTIVGNVTFGVPGALTGDVDTAMSFDGETAGIDYGEAAFEFTGNQPYSLEAWALATKIDSAYRFVFSKNDDQNDAGRQEYGLFVHEDGTDSLFVAFERYVNGDSNAAATSTTTGTWFHLVSVYDGANVDLYVNGTRVDSAPIGASAPTINGDFCVGLQDPLDDGPWQGSIDEVAIYDKALTAAQIAHHYAIGTGQ